MISAASGRRRRRRIDSGGPRWPRKKMRSRTTRRGSSGRVSRRRGQGRYCGARERVGEERGWRWPRGQRGSATVALGRLCARGTEKGRGDGRGRGGSRGSGQRREDDARRRGVQAMQTSRVVAWRARARAPCPSSAYWRKEEGDRGGRRRWAGPAGGAGQLGRLQVSGPGKSFSLSLYYFFLLFCFI